MASSISPITSMSRAKGDVPCMFAKQCFTCGVSGRIGLVRSRRISIRALMSSADGSRREISASKDSMPCNLLIRARESWQKASGNPVVDLYRS